MAAVGSAGVILVALVANVVMTVATFAAAAWTGSSAMLAAAIHALVDTSSQALLLLGLGRSSRPTEAATSGQEIYFWSFVVAVLLFSMGASVSIYEGVHKVLEPHPVTDPQVSFMVLGLALVLTALSTWRALGELQRRQAGGEGVMRRLRRANDAALFTVVIENFAALASLVLALAGIAAAHLLQLAWADGAASIAIGLLLAVVAAFMSLEVRRLIVAPPVAGEAAGADAESIMAATTVSQPRSGSSDDLIRAAGDATAAMPDVTAPEPLAAAKSDFVPAPSMQSAAAAAHVATVAASPMPSPATQKSSKHGGKSNRKGRPRPR